jgi:RNA polymerase sigma-70 factor (ECF subfamily)
MASDLPMGTETRRFLEDHATAENVRQMKAIALQWARNKSAKIDVSQIVHDVLVKAARHRRQLRNPDRVRTWMRTTLVREVMAQLERAHTRTRALPPEQPTGDGQESPQEREVEKREAMAHLYELLQQLPESDRTVICLCLLAELPDERAAKELGISCAALRQRRHRALKRLRELAGETP